MTIEFRRAKVVASWAVEGGAMWKWIAVGAVTCGICMVASAGPGVDTGTPLVQQQCDKWCWAASAEMVAAKLGNGSTQCEIVSNRLGFDCCRPDACDTRCNQLSGFPAQINRAFAKSGLHGAQVDGPLKQATLVGLLDEGIPVMLAATTMATGHFVVVVGYSRGVNGYVFTVNDPWPRVGTVVRTYEQLLNYGGQPWLFTWVVNRSE